MEIILETSRKKGISISSVVEEIFFQYFRDEIPGLCRSCRSMNGPEERFCTRCGKPLSEDAEEEYFKNYVEFWKTDEYLEQIGKISVNQSYEKRSRM